MRLNREIIAIAILIMCFIAAGLFLGGGEKAHDRMAGAEGSPDPSVSNDRASGSKGLFDWTRQIGYRPQVWHRPWKNLAHEQAAVLIVINPTYDAPHIDRKSGLGSLFGGDNSGNVDESVLHAADAAWLLNWVRKGHTAILLSSGMEKDNGKGTDFGKAADLQIEEIPASAMDSQRTDFAPKQPSQDTQGVLSIYRNEKLEDFNAPGAGTIPMKIPSMKTNSGGGRIRRKTPDGITLFGDDSGPFVLSVVAGKGRLVVVADSWFASNGNLPRSDNALFLANVLRDHAHPGDGILFDELHNGGGLEGDTSSLWGALGRPLKLAIIQFFCAFLLLIGVVAIRFGTPTPLLQGVTRTSGEYVNSLAGLYRRARASTTALETLYRQFLRDICGRLAISPASSLEEVATLAGQRFGLDPNTLRKLFATCEQRLDKGKISEGELLELTRLMETIRKDIGIV